MIWWWSGYVPADVHSTNKLVSPNQRANENLFHVDLANHVGLEINICYCLQIIVRLTKTALDEF